MEIARTSRTTALRISAWSFLSFVLISSLVPVKLPETGIEHPDKILHFAVYALLTLLFLKAYNKTPILIVSSALVIFGSGLETIQQVMPYRTGSFFDGVANTLGIIVSTGLQLIKVRSNSG